MPDAQTMEKEEQKTDQPAPDRRARPAWRQYSLGVVVALLMTASFVAGALVAGLHPAAATDQTATQTTPQLVNKNAQPPYKLKDVDFSQFWQIWNMVKQKYAGDAPSDVDMYYGAVRGMVASLGDPYSVFFDPKTAQQFSDELQGTFEGIGAEIGIKSDQLTVIAPLPGTPAEQAGLHAGDRILAIDGTDTTGMAIDEAVQRIRGPKDSQVKLLIGRAGAKDPLEITITRDTIVVDSVSSKVEQHEGKTIGIITISHFNDSTASEFSKAVQDLTLKQIDGLILDLRNNPGGYLEAAVQVAGEWSPRSVIVSEKFSDGSKHDYTSDGSARLEDMPTVVLVNGGSASAAEIVSGALQDYGKGYLIGEQTFGKGSVQDYLTFDDGSALKLTVARWLTPKGRSINEQGITPDETVKLTEDDFNNDKDPQMDRAVEVLLHPDRKAPDAQKTDAQQAAPDAATTN